MTSLTLALWLSLAAAEEPPEVDDEVEVALVGGQRLRGRFVSEDMRELVLRLDSGSDVRLSAAAVKNVKTLKALGPSHWFDDPNRHRYFYSPSAIMRPRGRSYFSQKELIGSVFGYAPTDFLILEAGTALPALIAGAGGLNLLFTARVGARITDWLHLGAGLQTIVLPFALGSRVPGFPMFTMLHGTATFAGPTWHVTLIGGMPFTTAQLESTRPVPQFESPVMILAASKRVGDIVSVLFEGMVTGGPTVREGVIVTPGLGVRLFGEHVSFDLGVFQIFTARGLPTLGIPIPYLDFTWNIY